jgi:hypothetical protein
MENEVERVPSGCAQGLKGWGNPEGSGGEGKQEEYLLIQPAFQLLFYLFRRHLFVFQ